MQVVSAASFTGLPGPLAAQDGGLGFLYGWAPLVIIGVLFYFMLIRPERVRRMQLQRMLDNLKKNDRVVTVGGIFGTVVNVQQGSDEITIKVDESTNTKLRVLRSAITRVLSEGSGAEKEST
jgi:preprotein translocase subunit YajC